MDSKDLLNYGFSSWILFSKLAKSKSIPKKPGVYVFRLNRRFGRLKGESDILYVGHTENLEHRFIDNYYRGKGGKTTKRIHFYLVNKGYTDHVDVSWKLTNDKQTAKAIEEELRRKYELDHDELPPWNRQK